MSSVKIFVSHAIAISKATTKTAPFRVEVSRSEGEGGLLDEQNQNEHDDKKQAHPARGIRARRNEKLSPN
jgi:hypothetical protein